MKRKIYENLIEWKNNKDKMPAIVLGVRQCGKTYIIEKFCEQEFKSFVEINLLERKDIVNLYKSNKPSSEKFKELKLNLGIDLEKEGTILFIDEIQECEELIQELKYFCEKQNSSRIICAGSLLGVKLGRMKSSLPVGKVKLFNMYPMDFEEFMWATNNKMLLDEIRNCYNALSPIGSSLHEKAISLYRSFQVIGGMPKNISNFIENNQDYIKMDNSILEDIKNEYYDDFKKQIDNKNDSLKIEETYKSVPSQLSNESNKFQYSKIKKGGRGSEYQNSISWLKSANLINISYKVSLPEIPLEGFKDVNVFKLFISDIGILNNMLGIKPFDILNDNLSLYKGAITENYVANEFISNGYKLYYWESKGTAEVDFLLYTANGIIPVEVKASDNTKSKSLKLYIEKYNPKYGIRISTKNFGFDKETKIKIIPLYAVFCIND